MRNLAYIRVKEAVIMKWFIPKVILELSEDEYNLMIDCLIAFRNQRIANGKMYDPINELLEKLLA